MPRVSSSVRLAEATSSQTTRSAASAITSSRYLTRDIQEASENGLLRPCDARTVSRFLLGGIEKLVIDALDREEPLALVAEAIAGEIGTLVYYSLVNGGLLAPAVGYR